MRVWSESIYSLDVYDKGNCKASNLRITPDRPNGPPSSISDQPRHVSNGSVSSQATFPLRPDAYTATDLSPRTDDILPSASSPPPTLPYPALAQSAPLANNNRFSVITSSTSVRTTSLSTSKSPGGFFAAIARNHAKRERQHGGGSLGKVLIKPPPTTANPPRPLHIVDAPSVPGGPRALPRRMQRSQTVILSPPSETIASSKISHRRSNTLKRPSLFSRATAAPADVDTMDLQFNQQVDKLADVLPHVERTVLVGYLRRAGQDMLAIGQYLEDEKKGTVRRD